MEKTPSQYGDLELLAQNASISDELLSSRYMSSQGFGTCNVLLTINTPLSANSSTIGCISNIVPVKVVPAGILSWMRPMKVQVAVTAELVRQANGTGVPSKYFDLPVLSLGSIDTVTLNRAKRVRPHRT